MARSASQPDRGIFGGMARGGALSDSLCVESNHEYMYLDDGVALRGNNPALPEATSPNEDGVRYDGLIISRQVILRGFRSNRLQLITWMKSGCVKLPS